MKSPARAACRYISNWWSRFAKRSLAATSSRKFSCRRCGSSRDLVINPNTVARAYTELEREGLLNNRPGRGVFVAEPKDELTKDARRRRLFEVLDRFLTEAVHLAFSEEEVLRLVSTRARQFQWNAAKAGSK